MPHPYDFPGNWFHFIATTYGAWLPGDERGFRTRHHRLHVEGDYKNPPPREQFADIREGSKALLKQQPTVIASKWRPIVGDAVRKRLEELGAFVLCLSVSGQHVHVLAKIPVTVTPRIAMGYAKRCATYECKRHGWKGKLWATRAKELPVRDRTHQRNVYGYILAHEKEGAWVWKWQR
jgi:hypothetical protein